MASRTSQDNNRRSGQRKGSSDIPPIKVACDRCRGQKLRCVWENNFRKCHRCTRAKSVCHVSPPRPMGRPQRRPTSSRGDDRPSLDDGGDETEQPFGTDMPDSMQQLMQTEDDNFGEGSSSNNIFNLNGNATQGDIQWHTAFPLVESYHGGSGSSSSIPSSLSIQPDLLDILNQFVAILFQIIPLRNADPHTGHCSSVITREATQMGAVAPAPKTLETTPVHHSEPVQRPRKIFS